jgi:hypothetical protein
MSCGPRNDGAYPGKGAAAKDAEKGARDSYVLFEHVIEWLPAIDGEQRFKDRAWPRRVEMLTEPLPPGIAKAGIPTHKDFLFFRH